MFDENKSIIGMVADWRAGVRVKSVTLGGISIWYEQAIQILVFEVLSHELKDPTGPAIIDTQALRTFWTGPLKNGQEFPKAWWDICKRMEKSCGYQPSYNQAVAAFAFARRLLANGPENEFALYGPERWLATSRLYPFRKMFPE